ncbi:hypothetical protein [Atopobium sp. oral taxon 810]|nr:hypothetical protein [Atopobium sp. oral taxon 810]
MLESEGVMSDFDTSFSFPTFAIAKPGITNTRVDISPYRQNVFVDAVDVI